MLILGIVLLATLNILGIINLLYFKQDEKYHVYYFKITWLLVSMIYTFYFMGGV